MHTIDSRTERAVLTLGHIAGMIDLVALPLWVCSLMQHHGFSASQAGLVVTAFLMAVAVASLMLAPQLHRLSRGLNAAAGFGVGAAAFLMVALHTTCSLSLLAMALWHTLAGVGVGVGMALSLTHGPIAAAIPAMMMVGSCNGPALGGAVVQTLGYPGLGWVASGIALLTVLMVSMARQRLQGFPRRPATAMPASVEVLL